MVIKGVTFPLFIYCDDFWVFPFIREYACDNGTVKMKHLVLRLHQCMHFGITYMFYMFYKICKQLIKYVCETQYNENFEEFVCLASSFNSFDDFEQVNRSFRCVLFVFYYLFKIKWPTVIGTILLW